MTRRGGDKGEGEHKKSGKDNESVGYPKFGKRRGKDPDYRKTSKI